MKTNYGLLILNETKNARLVTDKAAGSVWELHIQAFNDLGFTAYAEQTATAVKASLEEMNRGTTSKADSLRDRNSISQYRSVLKKADAQGVTVDASMSRNAVKEACKKPTTEDATTDDNVTVDSEPEEVEVVTETTTKDTATKKEKDSPTLNSEITALIKKYGLAAVQGEVMAAMSDALAANK